MNTPQIATTEPVRLAEAIRLVIIAVLGLTSAFDIFNPNGAQTAAILGVYATISVVLSSLTRGRVTPSANVALTNDDVVALNAAQK